MALPKSVAKWARNVERAEGEWARGAVDGWARTAAFSRPFRWGEAEEAVMSREYPPLPGSFVWNAFGIVGWVGVVILAVPTLGAALVGFVLVAIGCAKGGAESADWFSVATYMFVIAVIVVLTALRMWWQTRRRSPITLILNGVTVIASAAAYTVLAVSSVSAGRSWLPLLMIAAGVLAAVALVLELRSKPEGRPKSRKPPRRGPRGAKRARVLRARKRLLEVVVHRGLVDLDEADRIRVGEMPLGYWSELDGLDEREWRRVLERRHVGWREFDAKG